MFSTLKGRGSLGMSQAIRQHSSAIILNRYLSGQVLYGALKMVQKRQPLLLESLEFDRKESFKMYESKMIINPKLRRRDTYLHGLREETQVKSNMPILGLTGCERVLTNAYCIVLYHLISMLYAVFNRF